MKFNYLLFIGLIILTLSSGCKKKCDFGQDILSGEIKLDITAYPGSGYLTANTPGNYLITAGHQYADRFKISRDYGVTKEDVNYSEFSILSFPLSVSCYATFDRNVVIDDINGIIRYTINVKECGKCDEKRYVENYVVIRSVPSTYQVIYVPNIETY